MSVLACLFITTEIIESYEKIDYIQYGRLVNAGATNNLNVCLKCLLQ